MTRVGGRHRVEEDGARGGVDHGRAGDAERVDVPAGQGGEGHGGGELAAPDRGAGRGVEGVDAVLLRRDEDQVAAGGRVVEVERLGIGRALGRRGEGWIPVQRRGGGSRECGVDVHTVAGEIAVVLEDRCSGRRWSGGKKRGGADQGEGEPGRRGKSFVADETW